MAVNSDKTNPHLCYSPDLTTANIFLFPNLNLDLADISLSHGSFQDHQNEFATAFWRRIIRCKRFVRISGNHNKK